MGTTGASGMKKMFMGSTASNVIKNTTVPVLAIPNDFHNFQISNITIALDSHKVSDAYVLKPIVDLVKAFGTTLNLLMVVEDEAVEVNIDPQLQEHLKQFGVSYTYFKLSANNIGQGIQEFVSRKNSDMLCLLHHTRSWFQDLFHSSVTNQMAFESKVPLFVLRG
jgi:nucleotide-binding universal stress UspA family protein